MDARETSDGSKAAPRYVAARATRPRPTAGAGMATPPPSAAASIQRPRIRMRRANPDAALRFEAPGVYDVDATAAAADLAFDDDFQLDEELKMEFDRSVRAHRRPQRIKYVKCKTRVLPDLLVPYLYAGDRRSRMNAIMDRTGCTIDYCPESPDDDMDMLRPQRLGAHYLMCFLVTAETSGQLDAATWMLRVLVDRVQDHVEYKLAAGSVRRNNDAESAPRQDSHVGAHDQRPSSLPQEENEFDHRGMVDLDHLKSETIGETGSLYSTDRLRTAASSPDRGSIAQFRELRWIDDTEDAETPMWHDQMHLQSNQARHRPTTTRYHRPVYRRVLVDESGYEIYERPQYEHLQGYSPRMSAHTSPPYRRRRMREPMYHRGSSSEDESNARRSPAIQMRPFRKVAQRGNVDHDNLPHRLPMRTDANEHSMRRGMKRRLESYDSEDPYPRHRPPPRGLASYDYMSDDLEADRIMSGDEVVHGVYSEDNSAHKNRQTIRMHASMQAQRGLQAARTEDKSPRDQTQTRANPHQELEIPAIDTPTSASDPGTVHFPSLETHGEATNENTAAGASSEGSEPKGTVAMSVSIVFDSPGVESGAPPSDTESVADGAIAPSTMASAVDSPDSAEAKVTCDQDNATRSGETTFSTTSDSRATSTVKSSIPDAHAREDGEIVDVEGEHAITSENTSSSAFVQSVRSTSPMPFSTKTGNRSWPRTMLNDTMSDRLRCDSLAYTGKLQIHSKLVVAATKLAQLIDQAHSHERLQDLTHAVYRLQVEFADLRFTPGEEKNTISATLDVAMKNAADSTRTAAERVSALQTGLREIMASTLFGASGNDRRIDPSRKGDPDVKSIETTTQIHPIQQEKIPLSAGMGGREVSVETASWTKQAEEAGKTKVSLPTLKPKLPIPNEAPTFVSGLVTELERTTGLSAVMTSAQKRLLREISKSDPYYYLHPMVLLESARKGRGSTCPFGCAGASAHKWERKVVSQISSRMKWFDSVAYSLAKVSGGKELLSRKKMNSTIRKLHLVALQLHCLIAHLFCVRKRVVCREIDSLPTALNNSYYEKRMNGYKSRLKLTLHQQLPPTSASISLPTEELVRDTFEFYPELLLSVDVWGYDYRHNEDVPASRLPTDLLRAAARQSFDFDTDTNGLLQGICEELLAILCLWNDFKWGESLESLSTDDIVEFEAKVKTSIRKILEAHASHLLSQWSTQLSSTPALLKHIRLTQTNVYYSEQPATSGAVSGSSVAHQERLLFRRADDDEEDCNDDGKEDEDNVLQDFWRNRFTPSSSSSDADADADASDIVNIDVRPVNLSPLREDKLVCTARSTTARVLNWTEVYDLRQKCHQLAGSADRLLSGEANQDDPSDETVDSDVINLLESLAQARSIVGDAISTSEKLVFHSVHHQVDDGDTEVNHGVTTIGTGTLADVESLSDCSRDEDDALVDALLGGDENKNQEHQNERPERPETQNSTDADDAWKQPVLKDLVEIVTSTNQEISEICSQRARSARVRDKLQSQSLELARQSIQIFQTILNMKP